MIHHNLIKSIVDQRAEELQRAVSRDARRPAIRVRPVRLTLNIRHRLGRLAPVGGGTR
jgi:hypothetical protein